MTCGQKKEQALGGKRIDRITQQRMIPTSHRSTKSGQVQLIALTKLGAEPA
jgi:hypothetical protein